MIAVIADDFTGAAEMAGIALRFDRTVQLAMPGVAYDGADVLVIATDTRSMSQRDAAAVAASVMKDVLQLNPGLIYKKIDSVLRGHVLSELISMMNTAGTKKALVLPCNPSLGRTIRHGHYYIGEELIHKTPFANDPEFAIADSSVLSIIGSTGAEQVLDTSASMPGEGIIIGETRSIADIKVWIGKIDTDWLLAGGADFFNELLQTRYSQTLQQPPAIHLPHLYISGTAFGDRKEWIRTVSDETGAVMWLPHFVHGEEPDDLWIARAISLLNTQRRCIIAIDEKTTLQRSPAEMRKIMAAVVKPILEGSEVRELFIEGGSTASGILHVLELTSFAPVHEWETGVVRMKAKDWWITVKPGSYRLPESINSIYRK
jgi:uncharacterized protein YgbK (DUF1537 family)